jgi:hypothetical protein
MINLFVFRFYLDYLKQLIEEVYLYFKVEGQSEFTMLMKTES